MITEELKHTLDSLSSGVHEQARELIKTWKTSNDRIINGVYAPDKVFNTIEEIQEYFDYVHLESQEIKFIQTTTAIKDI